MSFWNRGIYSEGLATDILPLEPPATPVEVKWWIEQRGAFRRKVFLRMGVPLFSVGILTMLLTKPEKFLTLSGLGTACVLLIIAVVGALGHAQTQEKYEREQAIRWKRIREDLRISQSGPPSGPQSAVHL